MKVKELLEGDVIDFAVARQQRTDADVQAVKQGERTYGHGGYTTMMTSMIQRNARELTPVPASNTKPLMDTSKKFTRAARDRIYGAALKVASQQEREMLQSIVAHGDQDDNEGRGSLSSMELQSTIDNATNQPKLRLVYHFGLGEDYDKRREEMAGTAWANIMARLLAKVFGNSVDGQVTPSLSGFYSALVTLVLNTSKAHPSVSATIKNVFREFNLGGIGIPWVDKVSTGYRAKIEGVELVDEKTFKHLVAGVQKAFGPLFVKMKHDNEISGIGHRPVGPGLTNYRVFLKPETKESYRLS